MPYPNEHAARIRDPKIFDKIKRQNNKFGEGIDVLWGIKDGKISLQAIRFNSNKYSIDEAKKWLKEHNYKYLSFEEAIKKVNELLKELKQNSIDLNKGWVTLKDERKIETDEDKDVMNLFKGGPGSGPNLGQKNRLGTGSGNNKEFIEQTSKYKNAEEFVNNIRERSFKMDINNLIPDQTKKFTFNNAGKESSKTQGAIIVYPDKNNNLHILDGHHRYFEALSRGDKEIEVKITRSDEFAPKSRLINFYNMVNNIRKGGPGSGPRLGQKNRLGTGEGNNDNESNVDNYRTKPRGKFGEGYWITDNNDYIDITDDFGSASNDHVGVISAGDNKNKLGLDENDVRAINDSYDNADVTDESIEATNKIFNNGNIRARFFNDGTLAITARELNDNTKSKIIRLIEDKKIKPKEILYESNNQIDYKTLTLEELFKFKKGGSGSGNFGHSGRPGEVGGSSVDNLSSYQEKNPKGEFDEKSIDQLRETPKDFSGKFVNVSNASQEHIAKLIDEYNRVPDIVKNATDEIIYNNKVNIIDDKNGVKYKVQAEAKRDSITGKRNITIYGNENDYKSGSLVHELGHNFIESSNAARNAFIFNLDKYKLSGLIENEKTKFGHPDPVSGVFARFFNTAMIHPHLLEANYQHLVKVYKNTLNSIAGKEIYKNEKQVMDLFKSNIIEKNYYLNNNFDIVNQFNAKYLIEIKEQDGKIISENFCIKEDNISKGGQGSGNFGHSGRPGEVGGSSAEDNSSFEKPYITSERYNNTSYTNLDRNTFKELYNESKKYIPKYIKDNIKYSVRYENNRMISKYDNKYFVSASFNPRNNEITFYKRNTNVGNNEFKGILLHELGHALSFSSKVGFENFKEFENLYNKYKNKLPSKYSESNVNEAFAETFSLYAMKGKLNSIFKNYFNNLLKR